jgi:hypothetical protein
MFPLQGSTGYVVSGNNLFSSEYHKKSKAVPLHATKALGGEEV